jgi:tRNA threonylcarbamoyladenosine biosynthesis protein TsaE
MAEQTCTLEADGVDQTRRIGQRIGANLEPGDVIALVGGLGAGKTQLAKGIAVGAGVPDSAEVNSPTFVIVNEYAGRIYLYHIDAYRLSGSDELAALGLDEMVDGGGGVLIEWADRVDSLLPADRLTIRLSVTGPHRRRLELTAAGPASDRLLRAAGRRSEG